MPNKMNEDNNSFDSQWEELRQSLDELDKLYSVADQKSSFEYSLIKVAQKYGLAPDQLQKIFNEYHTEKRKLKRLDDWFNKTPFFSLLQRFSSIIGIFTLIISAITFLPTQQQQRRTETERKNIEQDRSHYEAWAIINNNRIDNDGKSIKASSGRISALQNLNRDNVLLQAIELPNAFLFNIDLRGADLYRANFQGADLYRANFSSLPTQTNSLFCIVLGWTNLIDCKSEAKLQGRSTDLQRATFVGAILYAVKFNAAKLGNGDNDKTLPVRLFRADFRPFYVRKFEDNDFARSNVFKQKCSSNPQSTECLVVIKCDMIRDPIIQCTRAVNAEFIAAKLDAADFTKADLKGANFEYSNLECSSFRGAIFNREKITNSIDLPEGINPSKFDKANIKGADFQDVINLSPEQIKKADNWEQAKYSPSLANELGLPPKQKPFSCEGQRYIQEPIKYPH